MPLSEYNMENLPEPLKELIQQIGLGSLEQIISSMDQNALMAFLNTALYSMQQTMTPNETAMLEKVLASFQKIIQNYNK